MKTTFQSILKDLLGEKIFIDDIKEKYGRAFTEFASKIITGGVNPNDPELVAFLKICLDVYTYSLSGEVLIPDSLYDQCMQVYRSGGNDLIVYADTIGKKWNMIDHEIPGVVGTIDKVYTYKELKNYLSRFRGIEFYTISPKYDGISASVKVKDGEIVYAATRYNGIQGQDITALVKRASNAKSFIDGEHRNGFYKCELCVSTKDFEELKKIKPYANRRSATSGIINTPSNLEFARFVTVIPLAFYDPRREKLDYIAPGQRRVSFYSPADLMEDVENLLSKIRTRDFPFRVDGVVINPDRDKLGPPNELDLMDTSIAFKVNTAEGRTRIRYGYMSVGRTGKAVPCIKVEPVEVNETIVEDVSLGSYDKFLSMDLKEGEEVIVYSAGDVIPQIKLPDDRENFDNAPELKIDKHCPYCGERLERNYTEYACRNPNCIRVITGRISNFLDKLGVQGFSDRSVEMIYEALGIRTIVDFLHLTRGQIESIEGFSQVSSDNLIGELEAMMNRSVSLSKFFGAMGIENISEKKCRKIFEYVKLTDILSGNKKKLDEIFWELQCTNGVGEKTASTFIEFVKDNLDEIRQLVQMFNIENDIRFKGNFCFTGFRPDQEHVDRIHRLGFEVSEGSVTGETRALFTASIEKQSTKSKAAIKKGIPIYPAHQLDEVLDQIEEERR